MAREICKRGAVSTAVIALALAHVLFTAKPAHAGGIGKFLGGLLARGLVREAIVAGRSSAQPQYLPKSYTSDVLTVEQLATCIKKASKLDGTSQQLEELRAVLSAVKSEIDLSVTSVEFQRARVNHYSKKSVDDFNALIDRHNALVVSGKAKQASFNTLVDAFNVEVDAYNAACVKRYYADDLLDAQKLAGQP